MDSYTHKIQQYQTTIARLNRALNRLSGLRLGVFVVWVALVVYLINERMQTALWLVIPSGVFAFGLVINRYNRVVYQKQHSLFLKEINEQELLRTDNQLDTFPTGQRFGHRDHSYSADLDIFGSHSLFQLLNRTTTESANGLLANWLANPASNKVINQRQQAIQELTPKVDWRQDFQASGWHFQNTSSDYTKLLAWLDKPQQLLPNQAKYVATSVVLSALCMLAGAFFVVNLISVVRGLQAFSITHIIPLALCVVVNSVFLRRLRPVAEEIINSLQYNVKLLGGYQALIAKIESEEFQSALLQQLQSAFRAGNYSAETELIRLKRILEPFQQRGTKKYIGKNDFYTILNHMWLLDIYLILLTEAWKAKNGAYLKTWALAVSEFEVLSSVAGFSYSNPSYSFPALSEQLYTIQFKGLGHPLLHPKSRITNDFGLQGRGEIAMITGSNMAGKSTFLRTVGINLVLALMGAPCCAQVGQVSNMRLFTSMRTQDNLAEGVSSFYAELKRIEQLLKLLEGGEAIFFLLDEMFKGTNSQDRYKGSVSLIKQLSELNAFGLISTHDLELAQLSGQYKLVTSFSFNSELREHEIVFNYTLTEGICTDFNASALMQKSGIKILSIV